MSPLGFDPWIFLPVVRCYTDYAMPDHNKIMHICKSMYRINNNQNVISTDVCTVVFLVMLSVNTVGEWDSDPLCKVRSFQNGISKYSDLVGCDTVPLGEWNHSSK
jgi:hypothetical protein